jgi:hypothetical protein
MYHFNCCGEEVPGNDEAPAREVGYCFAGKHTTDSREVDYSSNNVFSCEKSETCNAKNEDTEDSGEESEIGSDVVEIERPNRDSPPVKKQRSN